jgi:hypothetical protein
MYCGEDFLASKLCKDGNVPNGILVGDGPSAQSTIFATLSSAVFFLGDDVEGRSPWAIGTPGGAVSEHLLELSFRDSEAVGC